KRQDRGGLLATASGENECSDEHDCRAGVGEGESDRTASGYHPGGELPGLVALQLENVKEVAEAPPVSPTREQRGDDGQNEEERHTESASACDAAIALVSARKWSVAARNVSGSSR